MEGYAGGASNAAHYPNVGSLRGGFASEPFERAEAARAMPDYGSLLNSAIRI